MAKTVKNKNKKQDQDSGTSEEVSLKSDVQDNDEIVIDRKKGLIFHSEEEVYEHFGAEIETLEQEYQALKVEADLTEESIKDYEARLTDLFELPDEVWLNKEKFEGINLYTYIKKFESEGGEIYYILAVTYMDENIPSFIFIHFPTKDEKLVQEYRNHEQVFSKEHGGAGDALSEGDELATGLYKAMLTVRNENDIPEEDFSKFLIYRDETVEHADEIWRSTDLNGNVLVSFIKDFSAGEDEDFHYITVTLEDNASETHYVLFSFPTRDKNLVDRYRHGETLHTDEVIQEESH